MCKLPTVLLWPLLAPGPHSVTSALRWAQRLLLQRAEQWKTKKNGEKKKKSQYSGDAIPATATVPRLFSPAGRPRRAVNCLKHPPASRLLVHSESKDESFTSLSSLFSSGQNRCYTVETEHRHLLILVYVQKKKSEVEYATIDATIDALRFF